ncbi:MAG: hypothetical protein LKI53_03795 [Bacteroidales bacterium]|jgi:hypothetical protein|nr:hypothetical protein [Bacteroidales bacterium]
MARRVGERQKRKIIPTVIGAGITEQMYFIHLRSLFGYRVKVPEWLWKVSGRNGDPNIPMPYDHGRITGKP